MRSGVVVPFQRHALYDAVQLRCKQLTGTHSRANSEDHRKKVTMYITRILVQLDYYDMIVMLVHQ